MAVRLHQPDASPEDRAFFDSLMDPVMFMVYQKFTFWAIMLEKFDFYLTDSPLVPTACVTPNWNVYINRNYWKELNTLKRQAALVVHEIAHPILGFFERLLWRDRQKFNMAHDYVINWLIAQDLGKEAIGEGWLYDESAGDFTAEDIYEMTPDPEEQEGGGGTPQSGGAPGAQPSGQKQFLPPGADSFQNDAQPDLDEQLGNDPSTSRVREARDGKAASPEAFKHEIAKAQASARMQGNLPAHLDRVLTEYLAGKVDWMEAFAALVRRSLAGAGRNDYVWLPPNRRFLQQGMYLPSMGVQQYPKAVYVADTSGSRDDSHVAAAYAEMDSIRKTFQAMIYVMDCDAEVYTGVWVNPWEPLPPLRGGGGTDFRPIFEHIAAEGINPDVVCVSTDTWGAFPEVEPDYPTIWVVDVAGAKIPDWENATMIRVDD